MSYNVPTEATACRWYACSKKWSL